MTAEHSTYTYKYGRQETVKLTRGPGTPHGHALLKIEYGDGRFFDCYVNTAWLRDRADDLDPRPVPAAPRRLTPDAITDEMIQRARMVNADLRPETVRRMFTAALTEPPARPEGAEEIDGIVEDWMNTLHEDPALGDEGDRGSLADFLAEHGVRVVSEGGAR